MKPEYKQQIWQEILSSGEVIKKEFTVGEKYRKQMSVLYGVMLSPFLIWSIVRFVNGGVISGIILLLIYLFPIWRLRFYAPRANIYALTNKRVIVRRGWLSSKTQTVDYKNITDLAVTQGYLEKNWYNTGSILINTAGHVTNQTGLKLIENPHGIKREIEELKQAPKQLEHH